jgi:hypothetical protein
VRARASACTHAQSPLVASQSEEPRSVAADWVPLGGGAERVRTALALPSSVSDDSDPAVSTPLARAFSAGQKNLHRPRGRGGPGSRPARNPGPRYRSVRVQPPGSTRSVGPRQPGKAPRSVTGRVFIRGAHSGHDYLRVHRDRSRSPPKLPCRKGTQRGRDRNAAGNPRPAVRPSPSRRPMAPATAPSLNAASFPTVTSVGPGPSWQC